MLLLKNSLKKKKAKIIFSLLKILRRFFTAATATAARPSFWHQFPEPPKNKETGLPLLEIKRFDLTWDRLVLSETIFDTLNEVVLENRKQDILAAYKLKPKNKLLFCGLPGCGKTQTAKVLASVMGLPLVYVNLTAVFSSYLGETVTNLQKIFNYVERDEWVVLFDEFDAIARDRNTPMNMAKSNVW